MKKVIKIGKKSVTLSNSVAWTLEYRDQFNKDIVPTLMPVLMSAVEGIASVINESGGDKITLENIASAVEGRATDIMLPLYQIELVDVVNITWAMAKAANEEIDPPRQWVAQFDAFPLDVIVPEVFGLIMRGFTSSKNLKRLETMKSNLKNLQPSLSMTSSSQEQSEE